MTRRGSAFAPAKVNLTLHVTGRRPDGYHELDTLVAFLEIGDRLTVTEADDLRLTIKGRHAHDLLGGPAASATLAADADNLILRAARALRDLARRRGMPVPGAHITLDKALPVASGIGGGTADGAAALRLLQAFWGIELSESRRKALARGLGADGVMCLASRSLRASGIGHVVTPVSLPGRAWLVLANPGVKLQTPEVFRALDAVDGTPLPPLGDGFTSARDLVAYLRTCRNDLEGPAAAIAPEIFEVLYEIGEDPHCLIARMTGSGATCFGLYDTREKALNAAARLRMHHQRWWVDAAPVLVRPPEMEIAEA